MVNYQSDPFFHLFTRWGIFPSRDITILTFEVLLKSLFKLEIIINYQLVSNELVSLIQLLIEW